MRVGINIGKELIIQIIIKKKQKKKIKALKADPSIASYVLVLLCFGGFVFWFWFF